MRKPQDRIRGRIRGEIKTRGRVEVIGERDRYTKREHCGKGKLPDYTENE